MSQRPFQQVDVFTPTAGYGNPLAVVLDASGLDDEAMQRFARWTNLSETTFLLPPTEAGRAQGADYQVRIFTPGGELPFAGHPTLGSCHAWLRAGGQPRSAAHVVQECRVGLVRIRREGSGVGQRLAFAAPTLRRSDPSPTVLSQVAKALGLKPQQVLAAQVLEPVFETAGEWEKLIDVLEVMVHHAEDPLRKVELLQRDVSELQRKQKDTQALFDERVRKMSHSMVRPAPSRLTISVGEARPVSYSRCSAAVMPDTAADTFRNSSGVCKLVTSSPR